MKAAPHRLRSCPTGQFSPARIQALAGSDLVLRLENDDPRDWHVACEYFDSPTKFLKAAGTTELLVRCPEKAAESVLINADKRTCRIELCFVETLP